jgi:hypothetical protein
LATDGGIGRCKDFLFDDEKWTMHCMVADTGKWLPGRKVLIPPMMLGEPGWATRRFQVALTRHQIQNSPEYDSTTPINRGCELTLDDYYGRPVYWE